MGSHHGVFYGAVVGMSECLIDRKERRRAAAAEMKKVAKKAKRSVEAPARSVSKTET
jgi:hypothetical protein